MRVLIKCNDLWVLRDIPVPWGARLELMALELAIGELRINAIMITMCVSRWCSIFEEKGGVEVNCMSDEFAITKQS